MAVIGDQGLGKHAAQLGRAAERFSASLRAGVGGAARAPVSGQKATARAALALELVFAIAIGVIAVFMILALVSPLPTPSRTTPRAPAQKNVEAAEPGNPFRIAAAPEAAEIEETATFEETTLDLTLHGTWVDDAGGSAVIRTPGGDQERFKVGETIWNGVTLDRVYRDQVILLSNGARETLTLFNRDVKARTRQASSTPTAAPPSAPQAGAVPPSFETLREVFAVEPRQTSDGVELILRPSRNADAFAALGLRPGDRLVAVNNREVGSNPMGAMAELSTLNLSEPISVSVSRGGVVVPLDLDLSAITDTTDDEE